MNGRFVATGCLSRGGKYLVPGGEEVVEPMTFCKADEGYKGVVIRAVLWDLNRPFDWYLIPGS